MYQWNKPQIHQQFHTQEVITTLATDSTGTFLFAGGKKGWIYAWDVSSGSLLTSWQAHFKEVTRVLVNSSGDQCISCSGDGMVKSWDIGRVLDDSDAFSSFEKRSTTSFR